MKHVPQPRPPEHLHGQQVPGDADEREGGHQDAVEPVVEEVRVEGLGGAVQVVVRRGRGVEEDLEKVYRALLAFSPASNVYNVHTVDLLHQSPAVSPKFAMPLPFFLTNFCVCITL